MPENWSWNLLQEVGQFDNASTLQDKKWETDENCLALEKVQEESKVRQLVLNTVLIKQMVLNLCRMILNVECPLTIKQLVWVANCLWVVLTPMSPAAF